MSLFPSELFKFQTGGAGLGSATPSLLLFYGKLSQV